MARPSKFTPDRVTAFIDAITKGHGVRSAAALAGVSDGVIFKWLRKGREASSGAFFQFVQQYEAAQAKPLDILYNAAFKAATVGAQKRKIVRTTLRDKDGKPILDSAGNEMEEIVETIEYIPPNGVLALEMASRKAPGDWGRRQSIEHTGPVTEDGPTGIQVQFIAPPTKDKDNESE